MKLRNWVCLFLFTLMLLPLKSNAQTENDPVKNETTMTANKDKLVVL
jgi:hypothetical protein